MNTTIHEVGMAMTNEGLIQVGVTALRDPATGEFLPSVPLYIKAEDEMAEGEELLFSDLGKLFADMFRKYKKGVEAIEALP